MRTILDEDNTFQSNMLNPYASTCIIPKKKKKTGLNLIIDYNKKEQKENMTLMVLLFIKYQKLSFAA